VDFNCLTAAQGSTRGMEKTEFDREVRGRCVVADSFRRESTILVRHVGRCDVRLPRFQEETREHFGVGSQADAHLTRFIDLRAKALGRAARESAALRRCARRPPDGAGAEAGRVATRLTNDTKNAMDRIEAEELSKPERVRLAGQSDAGTGGELRSPIGNFTVDPKRDAKRVLPPLE
jgi:hypothetical protein